MIMIIVGGRRWNMLEQYLNDNADCIDKISLYEAIAFDAHIYGRVMPFEQDFTGTTRVGIDYIINAILNYCPITHEQALAI